MRKLRARQLGLVMGALVVSFWWARSTGGLAASSDEPGSVLPSDQPGRSESTPLPPNPATPPAPLQPQYGLGLPVPGLGVPAPLLPPEAAFPPPQAPPSLVGIPAPEPGAIPIQANNLRAPPILVTPSIGLAAGYTDNPGN